MRLFQCLCGNTLHFENNQCVVCGRGVGFDPATRQMQVTWGDQERVDLQLCGNGQDYAVCNWLVPRQDSTRLCAACRLNRYVPDLSESRNVRLWGRLESAKRRMLFTLLELELPWHNTSDQSATLAFEFLADSSIDPSELQVGSPVYTGHNRGTITINLAEADGSWRESMRELMNEEYRTLLGHFRHEIGHYYWDLLIRGGENYNEFRALFGDEGLNYGQLMAQHHDNGPPADWATNFVSAYASAHPWEDWAESWAHYMHMVDTLETAHATGFVLKGKVMSSPLAVETSRQMPWEPDYRSFDDVVNDWSRLAVAMNELNRSMGLPDAYPFSLSEPAVEKLAFVHHVIGHEAGGGAQ